MIMIDVLGSNSLNTTQDVQEQEKLLKSLRQVNEDDTLSRVLCADIMATRASEDDSFLGSPINVNLNEEVTLCAASHVETKMAECISDGIEATDIGSLLEQFLEYEKGISPALSPAGSPSFEAPVAVAGEKKKNGTKSKAKNVHLSPRATMGTSQLSPLDEPFKEIADLDMLVDNQITISTTADEDTVANDSRQGCKEMTSEDDAITGNGKEEKQDCFIVNRNGIVVVEYRSVDVEKEPELSCKNKLNKSLGCDQTELLHARKDTKEEVLEKETDKHEIETVVDDKKSNVSIKSEEVVCNLKRPQTELQSGTEQSYRIPKNSKHSIKRARSRSPLTRHSARSYENRDYSSSSDDEERPYRFERYRSERRTPMRRDDHRKRRKYSSCSDDEYDYYRYSKRGSGSSFRDHSPRRSHYEHDYNKPRTHHKGYYRSSSVREGSERGHSNSRSSRKNERHDYDDNVHERLSDLATPVPYDIEKERKIGFLVKESGTSSYERRNVYAGGIQRNVTKRDLIRRFECFGPVEKVTLHFREKGDNYAFVVFEDAKDAIRAVIDGNKDPNCEPLDLCFGGRRKFVGGSYVDFDANTSYLEENELTFSKPASPVEDLEFDALLEMAKRQQSVE